MQREESGQARAEELFEILGCYFARTFWENLYRQAQEGVRKGEFPTLEGAYRNAAADYLRHVRLGHNPHGKGSYFDWVFNKIFELYAKHIAPEATVAHFTEVCCGHFCPQESMRGVGGNDPRRRDLIRQLLTKTLIKFTAWVLSGQVAVATGERRGTAEEDQRHFRAWKQQYILTLQSEINMMCACIIAETNGVKADQMDSMTIPKEVMDKAQQALRRLVEEKATLTKERNEYAKLAGELHDVVTRLSLEKQVLENRLLAQTAKRAATANAAAANAQPLYAVPASIPVMGGGTGWEGQQGAGTIAQPQLQLQLQAPQVAQMAQVAQMQRRPQTDEEASPAEGPGEEENTREMDEEEDFAECVMVADD